MLPVNAMSLVGQMNPLGLLQKISPFGNGGSAEQSSGLTGTADKLSASSETGKSAAPREMTPNQKKLKNACMEFEAVMVSMIMKEGLKGSEEMGKVSGSEEEADSGTRTFKEMAQEQMAYHVGKTGVLGIGELLYQKVKDRLQE